jgi:hypothetical protein
MSHPPTLRRAPGIAAVVVTVTVAVAASVTVVGAPGCLFLPAIADEGYVACTDDEDCAPGFSCAANVNLCAPPPWHDEEFRERRLLVVSNAADEELPAGTAVPVRIGGANAVLALDDVEADARFADFDPAAGEWKVVGVYRDLFADRFDVWLPLQRPVPAGGRAALAWLEHKTEAGGVRVLEDPATTFALFDDCADFPVDGDDQRFVDAPGAAALVAADDTIDVVDNVKVVWRTELQPPFSVTFRARVNGLTCDEVFLGVASSANAAFTPPSAGFFVDEDLATVGEVLLPDGAARTLSTPRIFADVPGDEHRFTVVVDGAAVRFLVDDVVFDEADDIDPAFGDEPLFATVQVGGTCSVTVDAVWATSLPFVAPTVRAAAPVLLNITYDSGGSNGDDLE